MDALTISPATEEEVRSGDIGRRLRHFNYGVIGEYPETQYIRLNVRKLGSDPNISVTTPDGPAVYMSQTRHAFASARGAA